LMVSVAQAISEREKISNIVFSPSRKRPSKIISARLAGPDLSAEILFNKEKLLAFYGRFDRPDQLFVGIRLLKIAIRSSLARFLDESLILMGRKNYDGGIWNLNTDTPRGPKVGHRGHSHIQNDHIWLQSFGQNYRMMAIALRQRPQNPGGYSGFSSPFSLLLSSGVTGLRRSSAIIVALCSSMVGGDFSLRS
jgi:hypothetical protein